MRGLREALASAAAARVAATGAALGLAIAAEAELVAEAAREKATLPDNYWEDRLKAAERHRVARAVQAALADDALLDGGPA